MGILFGRNTKKMNDEKERSDSEYQLKIQTLQAQIVQTQDKLMESQTKRAELQNRLEEYLSKERQIAQVMINAQINAQKFEAQARARAEILMQEIDEELRHKNLELELLRMKAKDFKQEFSECLDQYKSSLEKIMDPEYDVIFTPTLVAKEKKNDQKLIG